MSWCLTSTDERREMSQDPPSTSSGGEEPREEGGAEVDKDARNWATFAHLSGILAGALSAYLFCFLGPLLIWLFKKDESEFISDQAIEALNFQITVTIANVAIAAIVAGSCFILYPLWFALPLLWVAHIVLSIVAAMKASAGEKYRYPVNLRIIR